MNTSIAYKNLSAHLLEQANPISQPIAKDSAVRASQPVMGDSGKGKILQLPINTVQSQSKAVRQARANLSGDDADFSISSMSDNNSSHRANKSTLNKTSSGGGCNPLGKIFGKNYFVDGEQLLRHISPSQPRSPRLATGIGEILSTNPGTTATNEATQGINLLNVAELNKMDAPSHLRLTQ
mgnify:CR=1 FL=1